MLCVRESRKKESMCACKPVGLLDTHACDFIYCTMYVCNICACMRVNASVHSCYVYEYTLATNPSSHSVGEMSLCTGAD